MMPTFKLTSEIIARSIASTWEEAKLEWSLLDVYQVEDPETCLCGHFPIVELCELCNKRNGKQVIVGNCCVKKFIGLPSGKIFQAVKRIQKNLTKTLNIEAIQHAYKRQWINEWEFTFYRDIMGSRKLTPKQGAKKIQINELILRKMKR